MAGQWDPLSFWDEEEQQKGIADSTIYGSTSIYEAGSTKAVDGDTYKTDKGTVRQIGIDTPETVDPRKPVQPFGPEASARAKQIIESSPVSFQKGFEEKDSFGRNLRYAMAHPTDMEGPPLDVGLQMIRDGLANVTDFPHPRSGEYAKALKGAMEAQLGMWAMEETQKGRSLQELNRELREKGVPNLVHMIQALETQNVSPISEEGFANSLGLLKDDLMDFVRENFGVAPGQGDEPQPLAQPSEDSGLNLTDLIAGKESGGGAKYQFLKELGRFPDTITKYTVPEDHFIRQSLAQQEATELEPQTFGEKAAALGGMMMSYMTGMPLGVVAAPSSIPAGMAIGAGENAIAEALESVADDLPPDETLKRVALGGVLGAVIPGMVGVGSKVLGKSIQTLDDIAKLAEVEDAARGVSKASGVPADEAVEFGAQKFFPEQTREQPALPFREMESAPPFQRELRVEPPERIELPPLPDKRQPDLPGFEQQGRLFDEAPNEVRFTQELPELPAREVSPPRILPADEPAVKTGGAGFPDRISHLVEEWDKRLADTIEGSKAKVTDDPFDTRSAMNRWVKIHKPAIDGLLKEGDLEGVIRYIDEWDFHRNKESVRFGERKSKLPGSTDRAWLKHELLQVMKKEDAGGLVGPRVEASTKINAMATEGVEDMNAGRLTFADDAAEEMETAGRVRKLIDDESGRFGRVDKELTYEEKIALEGPQGDQKLATGKWDRTMRPVKRVLEKMSKVYPQAGSINKLLTWGKDLEERFLANNIARMTKATAPFRAKSDYLLSGRFRKGFTLTGRRAGELRFNKHLANVFENIDEGNFEKLMKGVPQEYHQVFRELHDIVTTPLRGGPGKVRPPRFDAIRAAVKSAYNSGSDVTTGLQAYLTQEVEKGAKSWYNDRVIEFIDDLIQKAEADNKTLQASRQKINVKEGKIGLHGEEIEYLQLLRKALTAHSLPSKTANVIKAVMALTKLPLVAVANLPQIGHIATRARTSTLAKALWNMHVVKRQDTRLRAMFDATSMDSILQESQNVMAGKGFGGSIVADVYRLAPMERWLRTLSTEAAWIENRNILTQARKMLKTKDGAELLRWAMSARDFKVRSLAKQRLLKYARDLKDFYGITNPAQLKRLGEMSDDQFAKYLDAMGGEKSGGRNILQDDQLHDRVRNMSRRFVETTQFRVGLTELPLGLNAPTAMRDWYRAIVQFRTFAYKHGQEVVGWTLSEAARGNMIPMYRLIVGMGIGGMITGEIVNDIKSFVMGWERPGGNPITIGWDALFGNITYEQAWEEFKHMGRPELVAQRMVENVQAWGGLGLGTELLGAAADRPQRLAEFLLGPGITSAVRLTSGTFSTLGNLAFGTKKAAAASGRDLARSAGSILPLGAGKSLTRHIPGARNIELFEPPAIERFAKQSGLFGEPGKRELEATAIQRRTDIKKYESDRSAAEIPERERIEPTGSRREMAEDYSRRYREAVESGDLRSQRRLVKSARRRGINIERDAKTRSIKQLESMTKRAAKNALLAEFVRAYEAKDTRAMDSVKIKWRRMGFKRQSGRWWRNIAVGVEDER